ncbi:MAG: suppressor of fused domain protein [Hamadaea sp.]|nr:suppressor of fused domain protein [Hamadaea sp.]
MGLVSHLEEFLGEIVSGSSGDDSTPPGVQVVMFGDDRPFAGITTLTTLGLSRHHLTQRTGALHQELLMHLPQARLPANAIGVLFQVASMVVERGRGLARGEVVGPFGTLFEGTPMTALYATGPGYLPAAFDRCLEANRTVVMTMLVPITDEEAAFIAAHGWRAFDDAIMDGDPDLTDPMRPALRLAKAG